MSEGPRSTDALLAQPAAAGVLFFLPEDVQEQMEREGRYTGERLRVRKPEIYQAIVQLLGEKQSIRAIKRLCKVHHNTIAAVAECEGIAIDTSRQRVIGEMKVLQGMLVESLTEAVMEGKLKPEAHAFALAMITDKIELLDGNATVRIETGTVGDAPKSFEEMFAKLKRVKTGSGGDGDLQCGAGSVVRVHALGSGAVDIASPDHLSNSESAGECGGDTGEVQTGGGGGSTAGGLPDATTD